MATINDYKNYVAGIKIICHKNIILYGFILYYFEKQKTQTEDKTIILYDFNRKLNILLL